MSQQIIGVGTSAGDGTGDPLRDAMVKSNDNFTELYNTSAGYTFISQESDFPVQDGTTITLVTGTNYFITASFATAKQFVLQEGCLLTAGNITSPVLTYTGTLAMFVSTDASFSMRDIRLSAPSALQGFDCTDTTGNTKGINITSVFFLILKKFGTFNSYQALILTNNGVFASSGEGGVTIEGTGWFAVQFMGLAILSSSASFIAIDLGASVHTFLDIQDVICTAPLGGIGFKGAASNANMLANTIAQVSGNTFVGGMTVFLSGLTADDIRFDYQSNANIQDTNPDCLLSLTSNSTATTVSGGTPALLAGTWNAAERESHFTGTTAGRAVHNGERKLVGPVSISVTVEPSSGNNKDISAYLALDGVFIANSQTTIRVDNLNPKSITIPWQIEFDKDTFVEIYVSNDTDNVSVIGRSAIVRVR